VSTRPLLEVILARNLSTAFFHHIQESRGGNPICPI